MEGEVDIVRNVYADNRHYLTVCPWPDGPSTPCLMTDGEENNEYFGRIYLSLSVNVAKSLGKALIACAEEMEE